MTTLAICIVIISFIASVTLGCFYAGHKISQGKFWKICIGIMAICALFIPLGFDIQAKPEFGSFGAIMLHFAVWCVGLIPSFFMVTLTTLIICTIRMVASWK